MRWAPAAFLLTAALAGCIGSSDDRDLRENVVLPDFEYVTEGDWSQVLVEGPHGILDPFHLIVPSPMMGEDVSMGVFLPTIPGCDYDAANTNAANVPVACRVPVIVDAGPYYLDGDTDVLTPADRLGRFLIENLVPHGYAVVQLSARGTGWSGGCGDYMGYKEQADLDAAITAVGEAPWSSGAVAMIGRSYDGSTPWEVAAQGNPYLKTIVPISGIPNLWKLHYRNGTSEFRAPILGALYWTYGFTATGGELDEPGPQWAERLCTGAVEHPLFGTQGAAYGSGTTPAADHPYWIQRDFETRTLEKYEGSVFIIHGLQDWNVDPDMAVPIVRTLADAGFKVKALLGQWEHMYPDRPEEHEDSLAHYPESVRWDWAQMMLAWFDSELKGLPRDTGPVIEVQDNQGRWRAEAEYPPRDARWLELHPSADGTLVTEGASGSAELHDSSALMAAENLRMVAQFTSAPLPEGAQVAGLPQAHLAITPTTPGGNVFALLESVTPDGETAVIGHSYMDLRYAAGGYEPQPVVPGETLVAMMQFQPLDAWVPPGASIVLTVLQDSGNEDYLPSALTGPATLEMDGDASTLRLPIVTRAASSYFIPPVYYGPVAHATAG